MSIGHTKRGKSIRRCQWSFAAQQIREQGKFIRHLSEKDREIEKQRGVYINSVVFERIKIKRLGHRPRPLAPSMALKVGLTAAAAAGGPVEFRIFEHEAIQW